MFSVICVILFKGRGGPNKTLPLPSATPREKDRGKGLVEGPGRKDKT